jgi:hypothetical protein
VGDIVLSSGQRINGYTADEYLASDAFTYAVDYEDVAPFAQIPDHTYFGNNDASNDHNPQNITNGFFSDDGWQLIFSQWAGSGTPKAIPFSFAEPQVLTEIEWAGNAFYDPTKKIELTFEGGKKVQFATQANNTPQTFAIPMGAPTKKLDLQIVDWEKKSETPIVGVDNVKLKAQRPASFLKNVHPLLNIGTLMEYRNGNGGIVLCNINFLESGRETVPENATKKQRILATILRNLGAEMGGSSGVIVGTPLTFTTIDIAKSSNAYRKDSINGLPTGKQNFGGVAFNVYDFPTSPVPNCIQIENNATVSIPVGQKTDALFFLQTAKIDNPVQDWEKRDKKRFEMARYVIVYTDGKTETVPIFQDEDVSDYRNNTPKSLSGASVGWAGNGLVAYTKQWNNPRPEVMIQEIKIEKGKDGRGTPILLAITAAMQKK